MFLRVETEQEISLIEEKSIEVLLSKTGGLATALLFPFGMVAGFFVRQFYLMTLISQLYYYNEHLQVASE